MHANEDTESNTISKYFVYRRTTISNDLCRTL